MVCCSRDLRVPSSSPVQDVSLSRRKQGFESPWDYHLSISQRSWGGERWFCFTWKFERAREDVRHRASGAQCPGAREERGTNPLGTIRNDITLEVSFLCSKFSPVPLVPGTVTLDMTMSIQESRDQVEDQLREIFVPYGADVGGVESLGFFYATSYVTTDIVAAHITSIDHPTYSNVFFTSGWLYSEEGSYDQKIEGIRDIFDLNELKVGDEFYPELDSEKQLIYNDIINSIAWE